MTDTPIGTNSPNYTLVSGDLGATIYCRVTATNASGSTNAISNVVGPITAAVAPANAGGANLPAIADTTPEVTIAVSCTTGTWTGDPTITYAYQWKSGGTNVGTNSSSYTPVVGDLGATLSCVVTATNGAGSASATSNTTGAVAAAPAGGTFAFLTSTLGTGPSTFSTSAIDTTGAGLLIAVTSDYSGSAVITDNKGNTWTQRTFIAATAGSPSIWYCRPATVGTGHTVTMTFAGAIYGVVTFMAFSGGAASPFDQENGNSGTGSPGTPGSITPTQANEVLIAMAIHNDVLSPAASISGGFTKITDQNAVGSVNIGQVAGYLIQTTAAAANPSFTMTGVTAWDCIIASFKAS